MFIILTHTHTHMHTGRTINLRLKRTVRMGHDVLFHFMQVFLSKVICCGFSTVSVLWLFISFICMFVILLSPVQCFMLFGGGG